MGRANTIWSAILLGGLVAGTIDIGAAALIYMRSPVVILHNIAAGALGKASFAGGMSTAMLGLVLQWAMSILIAAIFVFGTRFVPALSRAWLASGLVYGVIVFLVMNYVVVPLSAIHRVPHFTPLLFIENMAAMLLFGLIIAYCARDHAA
jgi:uncharacterized membrane protein YagU involved in acid resistance